MADDSWKPDTPENRARMDRKLLEGLPELSDLPFLQPIDMNVAYNAVFNSVLERHLAQFYIIRNKYMLGFMRNQLSLEPSRYPMGTRQYRGRLKYLIGAEALEEELIRYAYTERITFTVHDWRSLALERAARNGFVFKSSDVFAKEPFERKGDSGYFRSLHLAEPLGAENEDEELIADVYEELITQLHTYFQGEETGNKPSMRSACEATLVTKHPQLEGSPELTNQTKSLETKVSKVKNHFGNNAPSLNKKHYDAETVAALIEAPYGPRIVWAS